MFAILKKSREKRPTIKKMIAIREINLYNKDNNRIKKCGRYLSGGTLKYPAQVRTHQHIGDINAPEPHDYYKALTF